MISSTSTSSFQWGLKHTVLRKKTSSALFLTLVCSHIHPSYQITHMNSADALFTYMMDNFEALGFISSNAFCDAYAEIHTCEAASIVGPSCLGPISACTFFWAIRCISVHWLFSLQISGRTIFIPRGLRTHCGPKNYITSFHISRVNNRAFVQQTIVG